MVSAVDLSDVGRADLIRMVTDLLTAKRALTVDVTRLRTVLGLYADARGYQGIETMCRDCWIVMDLGETAREALAL